MPLSPPRRIPAHIAPEETTLLSTELEKPVIAGDFVLVDLGKDGWQPGKVIRRVRGLYDINADGRRYVVQISQIIKTEEPKKTIKKSSKLWRLRKQLMSGTSVPAEDLFEESSENEFDEDHGKITKISKARVRFEDYLQYKPEHRYSELRAKKGIGSKPRFLRRDPESPIPKKDPRVSRSPIPKQDLRVSPSPIPKKDPPISPSRTPKQDLLISRSPIPRKYLLRLSRSPTRASRSASSSYGLPPTPRGFAPKKQPRKPLPTFAFPEEKKQLSRSRSPMPRCAAEKAQKKKPMTPLTPSTTPRFTYPQKRNLHSSTHDDDSPSLWQVNLDFFDAMWSESLTPTTTPRKRSPSVARSSTTQFQTPRSVEDVTANLDVVQDADLSEDSSLVRESSISSQLTQYQFPILKTLERGDISPSSSNPDVIVPAFEFTKHEEKAGPSDFHFPIHDTSPKRMDIREIPPNDIPEISSSLTQYQFPTLETPPRRIDLSISMIKRHMPNTLSSSQKEEIDQSSTSSSTLVRLKVRESSPRQQESDDQSSFTGSSGTSETSSSYSSGINNPWITPRRLVNFKNLATDDTLLNTVDKSLIEKLKELRLQYRLIE